MNFSMYEPLKETLVDAVKFLDAQQVPYALIGGLAVSLRGQARMTADVDLVILADVPRGLALANSLSGTNFKPLFDGIADVVEKSFILPLRHRNTNVKVDLALGLSGFEHRIMARAERLPIGGSQIAVATAEDLLIMKLLAGRPKDEQDIEGLMIAQGRTLDWNYCSQLAKQLGDALGQDLVTRISALQVKSKS
jgi:predicted nucleotidyltransferase